MPDFDAGVPLLAELRYDGGYGVAPMPERGTRWLFTGASFPSGDFAGDQNAGQWAALVANNVNPCRFVPRRRERETVTGQFRYPMIDVNVVVAAPPVILDIHAPTPDANPAAMTDRVDVVVDDGRTYIRAGRAGQVGIEIGFDARSTDLSGGRIGAIQRVSTTRRIVKTDTTTWQLTTGGEYVLDIARNQNTYIYLDRTQAIAAGGQALLQVSDSPAQEVDAEVTRFTVNEAFQMTLMFRSSKSALACWVPLLTLPWRWTATAERDDQGWRVTAQNIADAAAFVPGAGDITWTHNIGQYNYRRV